jgi:hypothetical protein
MSMPTNPDHLPDPRGVDVAPIPGTTPHDPDPEATPPKGHNEMVYRLYPDDPTGRDPIGHPQI